jgi:hypothetical protein
MSESAQPESARPKVKSGSNLAKGIEADCYITVDASDRRRKKQPNVDAGYRSQIADLTSKLSRQCDKDLDTYLVGRVINMIRSDFAESTWQAFERFVLGRESAATVAQDLRISESDVVKAKSRVMRRLRREVRDCID